MADVFLIGIILLLLGAAVMYIRKAKKRGAKCIGCPAAGACSAKGNHEECHCGGHGAKQ